MRGPVVETVLLLLLVVFFGIQQRRRPQLYFRLWTVAWVLVFLSMMVWDAQLKASLPAWVPIVQEAVRYDLILLAAILFSMALILTREHLRRTAVQLTLLTLPTLVAIDLQDVPGIPHAVVRALLLVLVVGPELAAIVLVQVSMPGTIRIRKTIFMFLCAAAAVAVLVEVLHGQDVKSVLLAQVFLCAGIHYMATYGRRLSGVMGSVGFLLWGASYVLNATDWMSPFLLHVMYTFWNIPKYFVGFSMALRVLEVDSEEKAHLVDELKVLYSDFKGLYESHPHPVWIHDEGEERFLSVNQAAQEAYGLTMEEFMAMRPAALESPWDEEFDEMERMMPTPLDGRRVRHTRKDGQYIWMNLMERPIVFQGREARMVLARDITDRLRANQQLAFQAHHDALTGLPNRVLLEERLRECLAMCVRDGLRAAILAIDVDHFKSVNDTHGHLVGDACLKAVAARLQSRVRKMDTIARTGGEEFLAVVGGLQGADDARKVASSLLLQFDEAIHLKECALAVTISIGAAVYPDDGLTAAALQGRADEALYEAKRRGRACVVMAQEMGG